MIDTAIAITTYVPYGKSALTGRLRRCLDSLSVTQYSGPVSIVDDGSSCSKHLNFVKQLDRAYPSLTIIPVLKPCNGGIAKAKNTSILELLKQDAELMFLCDDDIEFRGGFDTAYHQAHHETNIHHLCWCDTSIPRKARQVDFGSVDECQSLNGVFLTFTKEMILTIGGMQVMPQKWGHEHLGWSSRAIRAGFAPFNADIPNSSDYIRLLDAPPVFTDTERVKMSKQNWDAYQAELVSEQLHYPLET